MHFAKGCRRKSPCKGEPPKHKLWDRPVQPFAAQVLACQAFGIAVRPSSTSLGMSRCCTCHDLSPITDRRRGRNQNLHSVLDPGIQLDRHLLLQLMHLWVPCRRRIEQSDASRLQGQSNLDQLKADFDKLSAYVSRSPSLDPTSTPRRSGSLTSGQQSANDAICLCFCLQLVCVQQGIGYLS